MPTCPQVQQIMVTRDGHDRQAASASLVAAGRDFTIRFVDCLQRDNMQLAGLIGSLQERNASLEAQLALPPPATRARALLGA